MNRHKVVGKVGKFNLCFRPERLTSPAGGVWLHDCAQRLGVAHLLDDALAVQARQRGDPASDAVGSVVYNPSLGGPGLSDRAVGRGDPGRQELGGVEPVLAPPTAGELLRKCDRGEVHDVPRVTLRRHQRGRPQPAAPPGTSDRASRISEQASPGKEGSTRADKGEIGYPPLCAVGAAAGEGLLSQLRRGRAHPARQAGWVLRPTRTRVPAGATRTRRAARGFDSKAVGQGGAQEGSPLTSTADQPQPLLQALPALPERCWRPRPEYDRADVAELRSQPPGWDRPSRSVVNREGAERKSGER